MVAAESIVGGAGSFLPDNGPAAAVGFIIYAVAKSAMSCDPAAAASAPGGVRSSKAKNASEIQKAEKSFSRNIFVGRYQSPVLGASTTVRT